MVTLTFAYRTGSLSIRRVFQERRVGFLQQGQVIIKDGRNFDADGHLTYYNLVRPYFFSDPARTSGAQVPPGSLGMSRLQFMKGRVQIRGATHKTLLLTYSPTHQFLRGRLTITSSSASGSLKDFAIWGLTQTDPHLFYVETATDLDSGVVASQFTRHSAVFVPHRKTKYLAVGAKVYSMPNTGTWRNQYFKKWMLEKAYIGASFPTSQYGQAREVVVTVKPDRLNYFTNPGFETNANDVSAGAGAPTMAISSTVAMHGAKSLQVTSTAAASDLSVVWASGVVMPNGPWTVSWYVRSPIARTCYPSVTQHGVTTNGSVTRIPPSQWTRVSWTFQTDTLSPYTLEFHHVADSSQASGSTLNIDSVLLENNSNLRDYFDGSTSVDTVWETGGTLGQTRAYLYKNRVDRLAAIRRVLKENVPFGIGIGEPLTGVLTVNSNYVPPSDDSSTSTYGSGLYGSGTYGL